MKILPITLYGTLHLVTSMIFLTENLLESELILESSIFLFLANLNLYLFTLVYVLRCMNVHLTVKYFTTGAKLAHYLSYSQKYLRLLKLITELSFSDNLSI